MNDLLSCDDCDHEDLSSPRVSKIRETTLLPDSTPFAKAIPADVIVHPDIFGHSNARVNDLITFGLLHDNWRRLREFLSRLHTSLVN